MAVKRGKSQARRNGGNTGGMPGWAWLVLGVVITLGVVLLAPKFLKSDGADGFIRPRPNPDAQPAVASSDEAVVPTPREGDALPTPGAPTPDTPQYDFYTVLPGQEVAMSDAELAASARAEEERQQAFARQQQRSADAADLATDPPAASATPAAAAAAAAAANPAAAANATAPTAASGDTQARYILQAGAFGASGDAESLKARIALLGLNARVESAAIAGKTVYRVRMGPYGTATELAEAKGKLGNGGLPAMAIKAK